MLQLRDIMTIDVLTVTPETSVREAMELLGRHHVSGAPVVSGGTLLGVVTGNDLMTFASALSGVPTQRDARDGWDVWDEPSEEGDTAEESDSGTEFFSELWDDAGADSSERGASIDGPEWNVLESHDVSEVMTRSPLSTLSPDADVRTAADMMTRLHIHRVLVTEGDKLVGIVSALDVTKAVSDRKITNRTYVFNHDRDFTS
jgi:CBS domain-containing protein